MTTPEFLTPADAEVMAALAPILPGVKFRARFFDSESDGDGLLAVIGKYDIEVEAPREIQKMFHAMYGDTQTHFFHNYADTLAASLASAISMVRQMAFDYEAFRRTGIVGGGSA